MSKHGRRNFQNPPAEAVEPTASMAPMPTVEAAKPKGQERIGDILRNARTERGDDLYIIAEYLCIKPAFLIALENSRYDEFPADAYVIGFLRTYATYLGVDGKEAVDRYRYEMAGRRKKPVLLMPTPVSEGRAPSGIIIVGATVVVLLIYALWYGLSSSNRTAVNAPPTLPTAVQPVALNTDTTAAAGLTAPVAPTPAPFGSEAPAPSPLMVPAASGVVEPLPQPAANSELKPPALTPTSVAEPVAVGSADPNAPDAAKDDKKVYGDPNKTSRLIIRATQNAWVMVVDDSGKTIFDHVLRPGEVYKVPDESGLLLTTGNGAGINLTLDGRGLPKIAAGTPHVVRNINLDPDHLRPD